MNTNYDVNSMKVLCIMTYEHMHWKGIIPSVAPIHAQFIAMAVTH